MSVYTVTIRDSNRNALSLAGGSDNSIALGDSTRKVVAVEGSPQTIVLAQNNSQRSVTLSETSQSPVSFTNGSSFAVLQVSAGRGPRGAGWTGVTYDTSTARLTFTSNDGLGYVTDPINITGDLDAAVAAAEAAQAAAEAAEANTISIFDQFGDQYLGAKTADPTVDNDGDPLTEGDIYFNTTDNVLKFYTGTVWVAPEDVATTAATNAQAAQAAAETAEANAATSETNAASSATAAAASATSAASSATNAASSASAAATSATNASTSETNAAASASAAATSETNAATSETNAAASASAASTSETNAAASAASASTSETNAAASASAAATSETNAATSASNAATSETNAAASASAAAVSYDDFDDRYLGAKASEPTVDNDGDPLITGALFFDTTASAMKVYDGANWVSLGGSVGAIDADTLDGLDSTSFLRSDVDDSTSGSLTVNGDIYGRSEDGQYSSIYRIGGIYFTWDSDSYGDNNFHSIRSTNGDAYGDDITINSFGDIRMNIDSNNNGTNTFSIGQGTTGTGNTIFTLTEAGKLSVTSEVETPLVDTNSVQIGSLVTLQESTDRADLLQITSNTSTWGGLQIRNSSNEGRWSFMTNGSTAGIYDDENNDWHILMTENQGVQLMHNASTKLATESNGVNVIGQYRQDNVYRRWVDVMAVVDNTGTYVNRRNHNISSTTDRGVGVFQLNFTWPFPDTYYSIAGSADTSGGTTVAALGYNTSAYTNLTTSSVAIAMEDVDAGYRDYNRNGVLICGEL